jgi:putative transposase
MQNVCTDFEADLKEFNCERDHVHLLAHYPPQIQLSKLVNSLMGVDSRRLGSENTGQANRAIMHGHFWSRSYFAESCSGAPLTVVKRYIESQQHPTG